MAAAPLCTVCNLPVNVPEHLSPPDDKGRCGACVQLLTPGMLERMAANGMPECFQGSRWLTVRLAALAIAYRGGTRQ